ncbi:putative RNA-directed RNA polymerase [Aspergillus campestris IBT 28561]|uniref:RNA-dependent RNA polymerase n=1 Tax=Aspergillus campestris (strain IBT 28561) TaxID=1392248 RepID=A0A2I1D8U0_ASPC2|nr:putative RNA-directed RNA polymerase [Aspergillus campestris IBT 28561]PKY06294.1 putative RNA-directed RNA polymerase [Aspergillus campestris IBT 28561]
MPQPRTPLRSGQELCQLIDELNSHFNLDIPNPLLYSPSADSGVGRGDGSLRWRIYRGMQRLYFDRNVDLYKIINSFDDWDRVQHRRDDRLVYLLKLIDDEAYLRGSSTSFSFSCLETIEEPPPPPLLPPPSVSPSKSLKRRISDEEDEFHTAPSSPVKLPAGSPMLVDRTRELEEDAIMGGPVYASKVSRMAEEPWPVSRFSDKLTASMNDCRYDAAPSVQNPDHSFSTTMTTDPPSFFSNPRDQLNTSFNSTVTDITVPCFETETQYEDSVADHMLSQEHMMSFGSSTVEVPEPRYSREGEIMGELLANGPFSWDQPFPGTVPLRYRYEVERIGRAWDVPLNQMLVGSSISFKTRDQFWDWIKNHNQRGGKPLPEKPHAKAWDAATGSFQTAKHSEVVVLSGEMTWCDKSEPGILKLNLRPLKTERTCRFHRRFGSDRFLSVVLPAPSRPPAYLKMPSQPALLRETLALWLTQNVHRCAGRTWQPFFVEEVKSKNKRASSEPRFRVDFFAIDGVDFNASFSLSSALPPVRQESEHRTPMSLDALLEWHMPREANKNQTNCKLFQRLHLGLSKTFATVTLTPQQVFYLRDLPNRTVMNDGCALMSRALAQRVCDSLGITGSTPSSFQGRIAGAKGLWMVDKHASHVAAGPDDIWIQISDSQLKIGPHPREWHGPIDDEKLTFEVVKWSKPLHPVALNTQLLAVLEHGGPVRKYIGEITRAGIQSLYRDFEDVFQTDCPLRCRALVQKLRPAAADASDTRRLDQWASNNTECIIRLTEAGFRPRSFYPLRTRLRKCLCEVLDRYVDDLHIQVPLSTYAFCIADPYGVLNEDEVHFGLSTQWTDPAGQFEDNLLDGIDVLVGRLPAHLPSDIQRRRAVWHPQLRHFKDVIVFPTTGTTSLAHMLSGGDYDGDTPWICWDQNIVQHFANSPLPKKYPAKHYGLTSHYVPMTKISTSDEFLQSAFTFNLTMSQLGRCTVEHEIIAYDKSINSPTAIKLACLLGHLVDGRKAGVQLSENAWQSYRKTINPNGRRVVPAYKNPSREYKVTNIIDYLKFVVASNERSHLLTQLEKTLNDSGSRSDRDEDLTRPWRDAKAASKDSKDAQLQAELDRAERETDALFRQWGHSLGSKDEGSSSELAWQAAEKARDITPPVDHNSTSKQQHPHPLIHIWHHRPEIWLEFLASLTYTKHPFSAFVIHAFGEELCRVKTAAAAVGAGGSRAVVHDVLGCYRVSQRAVARAVALDVVDLVDGEVAGGEGEEEFDGVEAIQDWVSGGGGGGSRDYDWDPDDGGSVE